MGGFGIDRYITALLGTTKKIEKILTSSVISREPHLFPEETYASLCLF